MSISRRTNFQTSRAPAGGEDITVDAMFEEIAEGVFRRRYPSLDLNVGVVIGEDGALVIDTRASARQGLELAEELAAITTKPVRWVANTHWHWDHTFGNCSFEGAEIWGHRLCRVALEQRGQEIKQTAREWMGADHHADIASTRIMPPSFVFSAKASIEIGREVQLSYHGFAHTDADIVVTVPGAGVSFAGDLVEESAPPAFGDSYPVDWPLTLRLAIPHMATVVVPGHGDVVDGGFVRSQQEELAAVADLAEVFIAGDMPLDEAQQRGPYPPEVMRTALVRAQATVG